MVWRHLGSSGAAREGQESHGEDGHGSSHGVRSGMNRKGLECSGQAVAVWTDGVWFSLVTHLRP
jgi:hypothetical protein